jgi:hypothetical protein
MSEEFNPSDELRHLIAEGHISEEALHAITGIEPEKIRSFLSATEQGMTGLTADTQALSNDDSTRLSLLAAHLTEGLQIGVDERLKATFESLTVECHLTLQNISRLTGLTVDDLADALRDPRTLSPEKKYELASKGAYLINAVNQARGR